MVLTGEAVSEELIQGLASQIDKIGLLINGLGIAALVWIVYTGIMFWIEREKLGKMKKIEEMIRTLDKKVDKLKRKS